MHRTGKAGVVPAFNIEGQFEREARYNKEANEKVRLPTCLTSNSPLTHVSTAIASESPLQTIIQRSKHHPRCGSAGICVCGRRTQRTTAKSEIGGLQIDRTAESVSIRRSRLHCCWEGAYRIGFMDRGLGRSRLSRGRKLRERGCLAPWSWPHPSQWIQKVSNVILGLGDTIFWTSFFTYVRYRALYPLTCFAVSQLPPSVFSCTVYR